MGQTHGGNTLAKRQTEDNTEPPRRRIKLANRRHRLIARWSQYESSSEDDVSKSSRPRSIYDNSERGSTILDAKKLHKLSLLYADNKTVPGLNATSCSGDTHLDGFSVTSTVEADRLVAASSRLGEATFSSAETLVADDESTLQRLKYRSNEILFHSSKSINELTSVIRPLPTEYSAEVRVAEVKDSPESDMGPETEMVGDVARLTVLAEDTEDNTISWKLGENKDESETRETKETNITAAADGVSVSTSKVREPSSIIPVAGSQEAEEAAIIVPHNAIFGSSKRRKRCLANRSRSYKLASGSSGPTSPASSPPTVPKRPASRPPRPAEKSWLKSNVLQENKKNRLSGSETTPIWGHRRTKSVAASHMIDRQTNVTHCRRAVSMRDSIVDNDRAYNLLRCLDSGLRLWCKLSSDGYDSSILISDTTGNLLEVADDTQTTVICRMGGSVKCRVDISEAICV
ncbi:uncharacterized protein [Asterias amurensis]|uniref:uncharacterized protein isoform X1 n=1 Tax=Asterias amurensis TaxID=7602 RepID=UPI003AB825D9